MILSRPNREAWPALPNLLCDDPLASSPYALQSQVCDEAKSLASALDRVELTLARGCTYGRNETSLKEILQQSEPQKIWDNPEITKNDYSWLAHLLLGYRAVRILSIPDENAPARDLYVKTLDAEPEGGIYNLGHLKNWPNLLTRAYSQVRGLKARSELALLAKSSIEGGRTLADNIDTLGAIKEASNALACLENIQTAAIHLTFLAAGCTTSLPDNSPVSIPDIPGDADSWIAETERISDITLSQDARARIRRLVNNKLPNLRIQLLAAALISPILLFQPFAMENRSWKKKHLLQTSARLGNSPPPIVQEVERGIWGMIKRVAISRGTASLLDEVMAMFEAFPWSKLHDGTLSESDRKWFLPINESRPPSLTPPPSIQAHTNAEPPEAGAGYGPTTSKKKRRRRGDDGESDYAANIPKRSKHGPETVPSSDPLRSSMPTSNTEQTVQPSQTQDLAVVGGSSELPTMPSFPEDLPLDVLPNDYSIESLFSGVISQSSLFEGLDVVTPLSVSFTGAPLAPFYSSDPAGAVEEPVLSSDTRAIPIDDCHFTNGQGDGPATSSGSLSITQAPIERHFTPSTIDHLSLPYSTLGNSADLPIDVEKYYYSHRRRVTSVGTAPFELIPTIAPRPQVQQSIEPITVYNIEGHSLGMYVQYVWLETLDMVMKVAQLAVNYPDHPLHFLNCHDGTDRSMFCHWDLWLQRQGGIYTQDAQRWRVLIFSSPRGNERVPRYCDFKTTVVEMIDRYNNDIVIHDLTLSPDPSDQRCIQTGNVSLLVDLADVEYRDRTKIYYVPPTPSSRSDDAFDRSYCSETVAYEAILPSSKKFHLFQNPTLGLSYRVAMLTGATERWQMGPSGCNVSIKLECGELYVAVMDPGDQALSNTSALLSMPDGIRSMLPFRGKVEGVWLNVNDLMTIPANSLYMVYSIRDSVYHKRYSYTTVNMPMTQVALAHSLVLGTMVCREPASLDVALPALCWIIISWHSFLAKPAGSRSITTSVSPEADITFHLPSLDNIQSVLDLFALINTIILMPAYDVRMHPPASHGLGRQEGIDPMSENETMLFLLARQCAFQLGEWFFDQYLILWPDRTPYLRDRKDFWVLSLLHHANVLLRYKLMAEKRKPLFSTRCTSRQLQQQIQSCLRPFMKEIQNLYWVNSNVEGPGDCKLAVFLDEESLGNLNDDPEHPLPLTLFPPYFNPLVPLPIVEKRSAE